MMQKSVGGTSLIVLLLAITIAGIMVTNYYSTDYAVLFGNYIYIPVMAVFVAVSIRFFVMFRSTVGIIGSASLVISSISWLVAEMVWLVEELVLNIEPFPSAADYFYVIGYPFMMIFLVSIRKNIKTSLSNKIISTALSVAFLLPTFAASTIAYVDDQSGFLLAASYTVFDTALIWIVTSTVLSVNNKKNPFWLLFFIGLVLLLVGDSLFIVTEISGSYYTGHPIEVLFLCSYLVMALALDRQINLVRSGKYESIQETFVHQLEEKSMRIQIIITSVVSTTAITLVVLFGFGQFTKNEADSIGTILVTAIAISIILTMVAYYFWHKLTKLKDLQQKSAQMPGLEGKGDREIYDIQAKILLLENRHKDISAYTMIGILAVVAVTAYYVADVFFDFVPENVQLTGGRYVVANFKGAEVNGNAFWQLAQNEALQVQIINANFVSDDKLDAIKHAILSEETVQIQNSELGKEPPDVVETYYVGWKGALEKAAQSNMVYYVPTNFEIMDSDVALGDISIVLSKQKQPDRTVSFTQSIADESQHQILKSFITIYDIDNLSAQDFEQITRHEFGHALGLNHIGNTNNDIHEGGSYISTCNIMNMVLLYNDKPALLHCN